MKNQQIIFLYGKYKVKRGEVKKSCVYMSFISYVNIS